MFFHFSTSFFSPHRWIIASEGRRRAPSVSPSPHVKASLNLLPLSVDHLHIHMTPNSPRPLPTLSGLSPILPASLHLPDKTPPADSRPAIRFHGNLGRAVGRLSEVGLHYPPLSPL